MNVISMNEYPISDTGCRVLHVVKVLMSQRQILEKKRNCE